MEVAVEALAVEALAVAALAVAALAAEARWALLMDRPSGPWMDRPIT